MKRKLFMFVLALALVLPLAFALTACNKEAQELLNNAVNIMAEDKVYDGTPYAATATATSGTGVTIEYKVATAEDDTYSTVAPTDAGTYTVRVKVAATNRYKAAQATKNFTITPRILSNLETDVVYNGTTQHTVDLSDIAQGLTIDLTFASKNAADNAVITGYTLKMNGVATNNYDVNGATCTVNIVPKTVTLNWTAPANLVYNGTAKNPTINVGGVYQGDTFGVTAGLSSGNNVNAGNFRYQAIINVPNSNYVLPDDAASPQYTITKKPVQLEWQNIDYYYNGDEHEPLVNVRASDIEECDSESPITVVASLTDGQNNVNAGTFTYTATGLTGTNANNYSIDANYVTSQQYTIRQYVLIVSTNGSTEEVEFNFVANNIYYFVFEPDYQEQYSEFDYTFYYFDNNLQNWQVIDNIATISGYNFALKAPYTTRYKIAFEGIDDEYVQEVDDGHLYYYSVDANDGYNHIDEYGRHTSGYYYFGSYGYSNVSSISVADLKQGVPVFARVALQNNLNKTICRSYSGGQLQASDIHFYKRLGGEYVEIEVNGVAKTVESFGERDDPYFYMVINPSSNFAADGTGTITITFANQE